MLARTAKLTHAVNESHISSSDMKGASVSLLDTTEKDSVSG